MSAPWGGGCMPRGEATKPRGKGVPLPGLSEWELSSSVRTLGKRAVLGGVTCGGWGGVLVRVPFSSPRPGLTRGWGTRTYF